MNGVITFLAIVIAVMIVVLVPTLAAPFESLYGPVTTWQCANAVLVCSVSAVVAGFLIHRDKQHGSYLVKLFVLALLVRIIVGTGIFVFNVQDFFGGDAWTYDYFGYYKMLAWGGDNFARSIVQMYVGEGLSSGSGWGMIYLVAAIYTIVGRNMLAIQFFNAVLGAATAPIIFLCAREVFNNARVAKLSGVAVAFFPSLVLWSSQGLKDGPVIFFLALCVLATLKLGQRFTAIYMTLLVVSLFCVLALRFYVFYMILAAIGGAFLVGMRAVTSQSLARQFVIIMALGLSMTYLGITRYASAQFGQYANFEQIQNIRSDAATSAKSGFGQDADVSSTSGTLMTIPMGLLYLMFAPFPWQLGSLRQSITLPEMAIWWASFPLLVLGLWFSIKYRMRQMSPILIFTTMLTVAYSVFQGNVGTAYRQRSQLLVFYFIYVAVGGILLKEKQEARSKKRAEERDKLRRESKGIRQGVRPATAYMVRNSS